MSAATAKRPFGISLLSILFFVGGILNVGAGIALLFNRNDEAVLDATDATTSDVTTYAVVTIIIGALVLFVARLLWSGSAFARYLVAVLAVIQLVSLIWVVAAYHSIHWYGAFWPLVIYSLVAGYLFFDDDVQAYYKDR